MIRAHLAATIRAAEDPALAAGEPLMQRAAAAVADVVRERLRHLPGAGVLVLVGGGNNGGDGLFAAAALPPEVPVTVVLAKGAVHAEGLQAARDAGVELLDVSGEDDPLTPDVRERAEHAEVWVDALAGLGVSGPLRGAVGALVRGLVDVAAAAPVAPQVVAVDLPSGLDADTGALGGPVLVADVTVTFGAPKAGLLLPPGDAVVGEIRTVTLGLDGALAAQRGAVRRLQAADARDLWPVPDRDAHKYTRGVVGVVAGSEAYPGAAVLCVGAAARTGAGMVRYLGPPTPRALVLAARPEVVTADGRVQAWVVGPGIGPDDDERRAEVAAVIARTVRDRVPLVVDAGALDLLPGMDELDEIRVVLTPHAGELATLLAARGEAVSRADVEADPATWVVRAARLTGVTVLLKGGTTVVADPSGALLSQHDGTAWMATAGSGDVLAGVLGTLLAALPEVPAPEVAALAALVHGRAGRRAAGADAGTGHPVVAGDVVAALPATIADLLR